jgi:glucose-1-phosphate adenylyltransferase
MAVDSTVSGGVVVSGSMVKQSLLFSEVRVNSFCHIEESVILPNVNIRRHCKVIKAIVDSGCDIPEGMEIGVNHDNDRKNGFRVTDKGVVLVTRTMLIDLAAR